jgi:hypothetical protein
MNQMITNKDDSWTSATINLFTKGQEYVYNVNSNRRTIDLSAKNLSEEVSLELFHRIHVQTLNLSYKNLTFPFSYVLKPNPLV